MILSDLRDHIRKSQRVTLTEVALRYDRDPEAIRNMV